MKYTSALEEDQPVMRERKRSNTWDQILKSILVAICSGSLCFGASQLFAVNEVKKIAIEISHLRKIDEMAEKRSEDVRTDLNERIRNITALFQKFAEQNQKLIEQNTELITLIRVQNQMKP